MLRENMLKFYESQGSSIHLKSHLSHIFTFVVFIFIVITIAILWSPANVHAVPKGYDYKPATVDPHSVTPESSPSRLQGNSQEQRFTLDSVETFQFTDVRGTDIWGWLAPNGDQYAIMGVSEGIVFVNVTTLTIIDTIPAVGGACRWQDIKSYRHYAYSVSECPDNGLMVMDMSFMPDSVHFVRTVPIGIDGGGAALWASHNLSIDTARGFAYLEGIGGTRNIMIHDLADPENPQFVGAFGDRIQIHDMFVRNDTAYVADASAGSYSIWDLTDKQNARLLTRWRPPLAGFAHNIWPTDDGKQVVTTEETAGKTVKLWNIEDFNNVTLEAEFLGSSGIAHNAHVVGNLVFVSHYESGVSVLDISDPSCMEEVAKFDTWLPSDQSGFNGNWGVFPHTNSSLVFASNRDGRLFILKLRENPAIPIPDLDADGVRDFCDNCPSVPNPLQVDDDFDGIGDVCGTPLKVSIDDELALAPVIRWTFSSSPLITGYDVYLERLGDSALICGVPNEQPIWTPEDKVNATPVTVGEYTFSGLVDGAVYGVAVAVHFDFGEPRISPARIFRYGVPHAPSWNISFENADQQANNYLSVGANIQFTWTTHNADTDLATYKIYRFDADNLVPSCLRDLTPIAVLPAPLADFSHAVNASTKDKYVITALDGNGTESSPSNSIVVYTHPAVQKQLAAVVFDTLHGSWVHGDSVFNYYGQELAGYNVDLIPLRVRRHTIGWPPKYSEMGDYKTLLLDGSDEAFTFRGSDPLGFPDHVWLQDFARGGGTLVYLGNGVGIGSFSSTSNVITTSFADTSLASRLFGIDSTSLYSVGEHLTRNSADSLFRFFMPLGPPAEVGSGFPDLTYHHSLFYKLDDLKEPPIPLKGVIFPRANITTEVKVIYRYVSGRDPVSVFHGKIVGMKYSPPTHVAYTFIMHPWQMDPEQQTAFFAALLGDIQTDVGDDASDPLLPKSFVLEQNFPNPFNPTTTINYTVPRKARVRLSVYNILGQKVTTLVDSEQSAGAYTVEWNGAQAASGIYFYKLQAGEIGLSKKMILLK